MHQLLLFLPLLLAQSPGFLARKVRLQRRQSDLWGPWSQWSPCSRTCGGGISVRERPCYSQRLAALGIFSGNAQSMVDHQMSHLAMAASESPLEGQLGDGGSSCVGPARSHRSCRTEVRRQQSCPEGARDFRAEQCAQFDGTEFQGRRYKWLPYYGAPNKCELNCIPKGENFYYKHREAVIDGTPCEPGKQDICVDGSCRTVGCDHKLDSSKQEDKCLQCGGAGTTCYPVTGTFDANDLSRGYNQILIIPMGATSIHIKEAAASRNFLAVKSVHGDYYLNGHWTIGAAGALPVASTILQYERGTEGDLAPEQLHARGPISEPLIIELISQEANPGVHYEYYLPLSAPSSGFRWSHGSWGDCSAECGGGHQARLVFCTIDNEAYPDHLCQHQPRPADRQSCNPQPCPQTKRWKMGPWTLCSASCGGGSQSRSVYCISTGESGIQEAADEAECAGLPGKPPTTQACNLQRCSAWHSEPWGECSVSCGSGVRRRSVTCRSEEGSVLHATSCSLEDRPPLTEACVRADCPLVSDQAWHVGTWGLCSKSCSSGTRKRQVICAIGSPSQCESLQVLKPAETELCNTQPCHLPPEVPSMQGMRSGPRDTRTPLGARESPASEATGGYPRSDRQPGVTPEDAKVPTCQPRVQPHLCSSSHISSPQGWAQGSRTAGTAPTGAVPMATLHLKGLSGKAALETHVSRAEPLQKASAPSQLAGPGLHPQVPQTHRPQAQQNQPSECRGSQFGCCYDNVALAAGPLGEGCVGQPSYAYPVRCLLPSAHGSCADWAARWYFIPSVGQCNRFWYGGCHGNANNFASEQECMSSCLRPQPEASTQATHRVGGPGGQQEAGHYNLGATAQQRPLPSSSLWGKDNEPRPGEAPHGQEQGPSAPGLGGDARQPSRSSSHSLAGSEPALVQATLGHVVRLFCPEDTPQDAPVGWQKDGRPVSSDRHRLQADGSLVISPLQAEDAGTYSCSSTRPGRDSQLIQLRITGAEPSRHIPQPTDPAHGLGGDPGLQVSSSHPRPTSRLRLDQNQPGAVDASAGQQVRLTCHAEGFPPPVIEWQKDGQPLSSPRYQVRPDGSLVISHVAVEDSGFYICVAFNGQDRDQRWVQLRVLGELTITGLPHTVTVPEGDTARLLCMVAGESVNIRWSRNGLPVQADGHHVHQSPDGTLLIYNSRARDEGSYTCSAYRGSQAVSRSTEVKVVPPAAAAQPRGLGSECIDQPELANCDLIVQAQLCGNEYYSSFCCATCSRVQPHAQPVWQQG